MNVSVFVHEKDNFEKKFKFDVYFRQLSKVTKIYWPVIKLEGHDI